METKKKILIVDDEPDAIEFLSYNLRKHGYDVMTALNGVEALRVLSVEEPDVIITDIMMPEMDGLALCRQIRANSRLKDIPVFFLSATNDDIKVLSAMSSGGNFFISKPIIPKALIIEIENSLNQIA